MAIDFPNAPQVDQEFEAVGKTFVWDGEKWRVIRIYPHVELSESINFPNNPSVDDEFIVNNKGYVWDGTRWNTIVLPPQFTATPTINFVSKDETTFTVTFTNNDSQEVELFYGLTEAAETGPIVLASNATSDNITFSGLEDGTQYTVYALAQVTDIQSLKLESNTDSLRVKTDDIPAIFTLAWDESTDTLTRLDAAENLTPGQDFDDFGQGIWNLRRCMVNDDLSVNYYINPDNPSLIGEVVNLTYIPNEPADYTGAHGQVMVEIPKFYWSNLGSASINGNFIRAFEISKFQLQSNYSGAPFVVHPAFLKGSTELDYIYVAAFEGSILNNKLQSVFGQQPSVNKTLDSFRTDAQARGTGWQLQNYWALNALQVLYAVEYANFDSQTTIGKGITEVTTSVNTGQTISLGNASGMASGTNGQVAISYRGVENIFGNTWSWLDGANIREFTTTVGPAITTTQVWLSTQGFDSNLFASPYNNILEIQITPTFDGIKYVSQITPNHFLAANSGSFQGSTASHLYDGYINLADNNIRHIRHGGMWSDGLNAGIFSFNINAEGANESFNDTGARLQIL